MKIVNSMLPIFICSTFFMIIILSTMYFTTLPTIHEYKHNQIVLDIRESNYDVDTIDKLKNDTTTISVENDLFYKVITNCQLDIPCINFSHTQNNISYLYRGN